MRPHNQNYQFLLSDFSFVQDIMDTNRGAAPSDATNITPTSDVITNGVFTLTILVLNSVLGASVRIPEFLT